MFLNYQKRVLNQFLLFRTWTQLHTKLLCENVLVVTNMINVPYLIGNISTVVALLQPSRRVSFWLRTRCDDETNQVLIPTPHSSSPPFVLFPDTSLSRLFLTIHTLLLIHHVFSLSTKVNFSPVSKLQRSRVESWASIPDWVNWINCWVVTTLESWIPSWSSPLHPTIVFHPYQKWRTCSQSVRWAVFLLWFPLLNFKGIISKHVFEALHLWRVVCFFFALWGLAV